jgi:glyoxylase-like metal-dependent hydrolase (beta-lactamase superfamily II)
MISRILPNVYMISDYSNSFLVEFKDYVVLIDAGMDKGAREISKAIDEVGKKPRMVLITHGHVDHINGLAKLKESYPALIVASAPEEVDAIEGREMLLPRGWKRFLYGFLSIFLRYKGVGVDVKLKGGKFDAFEVLRTPGHTNGSLCFLLRAKKVLFCGDLLLNEKGKLVLPPQEFNFDREQLLRSIKRVARLRLDYLLPGHGKALPDAKPRIKRFLATL